MLVATALAVFALAASLLGGSAPAAGNAAPEPATEVPSSIPVGGVNINNQVILMPPSAGGRTMDSNQAVRAASAFVDTELKVSTLLATVTVPGTIPIQGTDIPFRTIQNRQAWVVTVTSPEPVLVGSTKNASGERVQATHFSVVLDAESGEFLIGFYTT